MVSKITKQLKDYFNSLVVTQGDRVGEAFTLFPWETKFLAGAFAPDVQTAALSIGRGNGKTSFLAGIAAAATNGPIAQPRAEVVIVASAMGQAKILWDSAFAYLQPSIDAKPYDWSITDGPQRSILVHKPTGIKLRAVGSDFRRLHGLAPSLVLCDEPAQWLPAQRDPMIAALQTGLGKVPNSRIIALGTKPESENHWFNQWLAGGADFSQLHAASEDDDIYLKRTWAKANPSMRFLISLSRTIKADAARARRDDSQLASFKALRLNQGTPDTQRPELLNANTWKDCEVDVLPPATGNCVYGVDLGTNAAMSAVAAYWPQTGRLEVLASFPAEPSLTERGNRDGVGSLYQDMLGRGELVLTGHRTTDVSQLLNLALDRFGFPASLVSDRWREAELRDAADVAQLPPAAVIVRGQGFKDGGEDVRLFRRAALDGQIKTPVSLLMRSAMAGAVTVSDAAGNAKLAKDKDSAARRAHHRDDSVAAAILAVAEGRRMPDDSLKRRGYLGIV